MIYRRCKCGEAELWESGMPPRDCQGCSKCGTTYAVGPEGNKPLIPHDWEPRFNRKTGKPDRRQCSRCYAIERDPPAPE